MARVKGAVHALKRRRKLLKQTKGFKGGRKNKERLAKEALLKKWTYQFRSRRLKKRDNRALWQLRINAAIRAHGMNYYIYKPPKESAHHPGSQSIIRTRNGAPPRI